jgi:hypothetical protein
LGRGRVLVGGEGISERGRAFVALRLKVRRRENQGTIDKRKGGKITSEKPRKGKKER